MHRPTSTRHARALAVLAACAGLARALPAAAQTESDIAARRLLLEQAQQARTANDHARALELAVNAGRIRMTPSVRLFITEEQSALGQTASALGSAELCIQEAERDNALNRAEIVQACRELLTSLRERVGTMVVHVPTPAVAGMRVTLNGQVVNEAVYEHSSVVTPGAVVVEASAPGRLPFHQEVTVAVGTPGEVTIALPVDPAAPAATPSGPTPPPPPVVVHVESDPGATRRVLGWVAVGAGGLFLVGGAISFGVRADVQGQMTALRCPGPAACTRLNAEAGLEFALGLTGLITGALITTFGVVLVATAPSPPRTPAAPHAARTPAWTCGVGTTGLGLACAGTF